MLIFICLVLVIVGILTAQLFSNRRSVNLLKKVPAPPRLPILGNSLSFFDTHDGQWRTFRKLFNEYYPITCIWNLSVPTVFIRHPDDIRILCKSKTNLDKAHAFYSTITRYGNDGIILSRGAKWQERRKLMNQAFLRNSLRAVLESANKHALLFVEKYKKCDDKSIQNILPYASKMPIDIICESSMGYDFHEVGAEYHDEYVEALDDGMKLIFYRIFRPYITDWMATLLLIEKKIHGYRKTIGKFSAKVIEERRKYHKANGIDILSDEFLNAELQNPEANTFNFVDMLCTYEDKGLIDRKGMLDEIEILISAGYETTGLNIAFTILLLAENEREQNLARQEVIEVMKNCNGKLTIPDLQKLQYLDRCLKESLRIFPPVPLGGRKLAEDTQFSNYVIPRDTDVFMSYYDLHHDPNFWPEPSKFNPDRFLPEAIKNQHPYAFAPFSGGTRNCIGQKHATTVVKIMIAHVLYNFKLEPVDFSRDIPFDFDVVLKPTTGKLRVKFTKILHD